MDIEDSITKQAAYWFATLQDENHSAAEEQAFKEWLASSEQHQAAWQQVALFSQTMTELDKKAAKSALTPHTRKTARSFSHVALFSSLLLIGLTLFTFWGRPPSGHYQTQIGETKQLELADGTQLWLNTNTSVDIVYSEQLRAIQLHQGEIWVRSGKEKNRSYRDLVVATEDGQLIALGTEFSVRYKSDFTVLNVFEGAVEIAPSDTRASTLIIPSGQQGRFDETHILEQGLSAEQASAAWVNGMLFANEQPLCDFIDELNRYRPEAIQCPESLNRYRLVGTYPLKKMANILLAIETSLPVSIQQNEQGQWQVRENL